MKRKLNLFIIKDKYIDYNDAYIYNRTETITEGDFIYAKIKYFDDIEKKYKRGFKMLKVVEFTNDNIFAIIGGYELRKKTQDDYDYDELYNSGINKLRSK